MPSIRIVSGKYKNHRLDFPLKKGLRPTSHRLRQAVFNSLIHRFLTHRIGHDLPFLGMRVLDLFSGLGAYGFESLSLGALYCVFIEKNFETSGLIERYARQLGSMAHVQIITKPWPVPRLELDFFDLIFMDPPYNINLEDMELAIQACAPFMIESSLLMVESRLPITTRSPFSPVFGKRNSGVYFTFIRKQNAP